MTKKLKILHERKVRVMGACRPFRNKVHHALARLAVNCKAPALQCAIEFFSAHFLLSNAVRRVLGSPSPGCVTSAPWQLAR